MLAADHVRELVQPYTTFEAETTQAGVRVPVPTTNRRDLPAWIVVPRGTGLSVTHPSLLTQLRRATAGATGLSDSDAAAGTAKSKPAAHLEALDVLRRIDAQSHEYAVELDIEQPRRTRTVVPSLALEDRLLAISGKVGSEPDRRVRSWWASARLVTHWDSPPLRPHGAPCPSCWETDTLRIRLDDELAVCTGCGDTWDRTGHPDHGSLDMLGQHVRWCTEHDVTKPRHWMLDANTELAECTECLPFRDAYTDWKMGRARALLDEQPSATA
jgi:Zn ribbon nucleic-acid-binding protein